MLLWVGVAIAAVIAVAIVAAVLVLRSGRFQAFALRTAQQRGTQALGVPVRIARLRLHIHSFSPSADVYGVRIEGRPVPGMPTSEPLLQLAHARVQIRITSLLHQSWHLQDIALDRPIVHLVINSEGATNLPIGSHPAQPSQGPDIFALAIRHAAVHAGELYVNDRAQSVNADLKGVTLAVDYAPAPPAYSGQFSFDQGTVRVSGMAPLTASLALRFRASRQGVSIPSLRLAASGATVSAEARLTNYADPQLSARYHLDLDLAALRTALHQPALPRGAVAINGTAAYARHRLVASGSFTSAELRGQVASVALPVRRLRGGFQFDDGTLTVSGVQADVMGGRLSADATLQHLDRAPGVEARVRLQGARLNQLARLAPRGVTTLTALGVTGTLTVAASARGPLDLNALAASAQAALDARLGAVPLQGASAVSYSGGQLTLRNTSLHTPHASLTLAGSLAVSGSPAAKAHLTVQATSDDFAGLEATADHLAAALGRPLPPLDLAGRGSLAAIVAGTLRQPQATGSFRAAPLSVRGTRWNSISGQFEASAAQATLQAKAAVGTQASLDLRGTLALDHWNASPSSALSGSLAVHNLALNEFAPLLPSPLPVTGIVNAEADVQGTLAAPEGRAQATLRPVRLAGKSQIGLQAVRLTAQGNRKTLSAELTAQLQSGDIVASGTFQPSTGVYAAQLNANALDLARLPLLRAAQTGIQGVLALHGSGSGTVATPAFDLTATSSHLAVDGQAIRNFEARAQLHGKQLQASLAATALQSPLRANAQVTLAGDWPATADFDVPPGPLAPLLAAFAPAQASDLRGEVALHASLQGPLRDPARLQATLTLPTFSLDYANVVAVRATAPISASIAAGVVTVRPAHLAGPNTDFELQGTVPVPALGAPPDARLQLALRGTVNLKLAETAAPELSTGGEAVVAVNAAGTLAQPLVSGEIQVANASVSSPDWPVSLQNGHGALRLHGGRVDLVGFTASAGGGTVTLTGGMAFQPKPQFNLSVAAREVRVRFPAGLRETVSADVNLTGSPAAALLSGRARVESVATVPGFDFATLTTQLAQNQVAVSTPGSFLANLRLEVAVTTPNQVAITSRDFSLHANANVNVRGTFLEPVVLGRVDLTSGDLIFRGNRYVIQSGTMDFVNPIRTVPTVNVTADTTIQQYNLHLHFQGPVDNLRTAYTSDPALPPADIINLLAFGQTTESGSANPLPGNLGAETLVAGAVTGQITDRVEKIAGISHLSVDPVLGGGQQTAGARITIQQRVTGNLYVTVSTDVTSTQRNVIEVQYHFSPRVSISGVRKQNGGFGANLQFKKVWH